MSNRRVRCIFGTPNHSGVGGFLLEIAISVENIFTRTIFRALRGAQPATLRAHSGNLKISNHEKSGIETRDPQKTIPNGPWTQTVTARVAKDIKIEILG